MWQTRVEYLQLLNRQLRVILESNREANHTAAFSPSLLKSRAFASTRQAVKEIIPFDNSTLSALTI
jgi:hypothetical protein